MTVGAGSQASQDQETAEATGCCRQALEQERMHREKLRQERPLLSAGPTNALDRLVRRVLRSTEP